MRRAVGDLLDDNYLRCSGLAGQPKVLQAVKNVGGYRRASETLVRSCHLEALFRC